MAQIEVMQTQLAHNKAQLLGVIEAVRAQPEGVPCSMGQKQKRRRSRPTAILNVSEFAL